MLRKYILNTQSFDYTAIENGDDTRAFGMGSAREGEDDLWGVILQQGRPWSGPNGSSKNSLLR